MLNFIRFDLSKMFRMKSLWITLLVFNLFIGLITFINYKEISLTYDQYVELSQTTQETEANVANSTKLEVEMQPQGQVMDEASFKERQATIKESMTFDRILIDNFAAILIFAYIYLAIFVSSDFSSGFMKNMLAIAGSKQKWLGSKLIVAVAFYVILLVNHMVWGLINEFISGQFLSRIHWTDHLTLFLPQAAMLVIIILLVTAVLLWSQSRVSTIVFATLLGMGFHGQLLNFIGQGLNINLVEQLYSSQIMLMGTNFQEYLVSVLIRALIIIIGLYLFNSWRIYRMDFNFEH